MLYPSIQDLTQGKINRYTLVMATAKCARHVTQKLGDEREQAALNGKESKSEVTADSVNDKAVTTAINRIYEGRYKILDK